MSSWRPREANKTLSGVYKFEIVRYIYTHGGTYALIIGIPRISNVGGVRPLPFFKRASSFKCSNHLKWHGHSKCFKWNRALGFECSIQSSVYGATTVAKVSLFSTWT